PPPHHPKKRKTPGALRGGRRDRRSTTMKPTILPETPQPSQAHEELWSSDAIARMLQALDVPWVSLVPGASFRGLHDSLVNHTGNQRPQMILCLHEGAAVSVAHGYAKASGRMMATILHSNVGLRKGSMGIFNAGCDRVPMLILGATGPWDAAKRRPWIDWIHTASDQGALVRGYTKWDNQPGSVPAAYDALLRAAQMATTAPCGPTYVNLDAALQESELRALAPRPDHSRLRSSRHARRQSCPARQRRSSSSAAESARSRAGGRGWRWPRSSARAGRPISKPARG